LSSFIRRLTVSLGEGGQRRVEREMTVERTIPLVIIALGTAIRIPQLGHGLNEMHAFRQSRTAYVAQQYARDGIDLTHTPLPIFGSDSDFPMEVPLVQATA
jgi:hypothetical protein